MKSGRIFGLVCLFLGLAFTSLGYMTLVINGLTLQILVLGGPMLGMFGLAMTIVPGTKYTNKDLRIRRVSSKSLLYKASLGAKIIWLLAVIVGMYISFGFQEEFIRFFSSFSR